MNKSQKELITTGKAADLCSVNPDTVLKWIKKNRINAVRTAGGHYRIHPEDLEPFLTKNESSGRDLPLNAGGNRNLPCYAFFAKDKKIRPDCLGCIVFQSKAERCYVIASRGKKAGLKGMVCSSDCRQCRYFQTVHERLEVLIITRNRGRYESDPITGVESLDIRFASCGYEVSEALNKFEPRIIVLDYTVPESDVNELSRHLKSDSRLSGSIVIFAARGRVPHKGFRGIDGVVRVPFTRLDLDRIVQSQGRGS